MIILIRASINWGLTKIFQSNIASKQYICQKQWY